MGGEPPTDRDRLTLFCALVDQYDELAEAFPVAEKSFRFGGSNARPPKDHWHRTIRAMALRKFLLASSDPVYFEKVLRSMEACIEHESVTEVTAAFRERVHESHTWLRYSEDEGVDKTVDVLIRDIVYGGLLHGDFEKWQRTRERAVLSVEMATWQFVDGAEAVVRRLREAIMKAVDEGLLEPAPGTSET